MTQSPQVKDLGMSGGVRANLRVIGLVSPKNMTAVEALVSTQLIPKPDGGMDELRSIMAASPVGRAVFDGKIARWLPMPKLENHSGFDRDNRSLSDEVPETRSTSPTIAPPPPESTRSRRGRITIPTRRTTTDARQELEQAWEVPLNDKASKSDFDRLMDWFKLHPDKSPTVAELKSVHKFTMSGNLELDNLLEAASLMTILICDSTGKANRYQWAGEF